jgi:hypothetical protein
MISSHYYSTPFAASFAHFSLSLFLSSFLPFTGRMKDSDFRNRVVDCAEEFAKFAAIMTPVADHLTDRYSERKEKEEKGRLQTQAEKEALKDAAAAAAAKAATSSS